MKKEISSEIRCGECNSIKKSAEYDEFCEYCEKKLDWNIRTGYEFSIELMGSIDSIDHLNFCGLECGLKWMSEKADEYFVKRRSEDNGEYPHYILSFHKSDELKQFQKIIISGLTKEDEGKTT